MVAETLVGDLEATAYVSVILEIVLWVAKRSSSIWAHDTTVY